MYHLQLDKQQFLSEYWQKKPCVIRSAFKDFIDPITAEELAGLACEEEVSSRIVLTSESGWDVKHGPFETYEEYGENRWQLLVQAVNHWHPNVEPLVEAFRFLPDWRFDDLMASFATPDGGVGPHIDNYDVFIIQGEGQRKWKVGNKGEHKQRDNDPQSALVEDFEAIIDVTLESGDILYIPPGYPHCGETLSVAMSYSVGFRAPSQQEMFTEVADYLLDNDIGLSRFTSADETANKGLIGENQQQGLMDLIGQITASPNHYHKMLGELLSRNRFELDLCPDEDITETEYLLAIEDGADIKRLGGIKILRLENDQEQRLFVGGNAYILAESSHESLKHLSNEFTLTNSWLHEHKTDPAINKFLIELLQQGCLYFSE
ncbi:cupin domain-containing protein [Parashewanella spongiae]|uniref:Cupin domain-containing protein n=1 Tax=Parashewanella spongiae TaxID=342950 RepID=A0A3A6TPH6_9GAMM|nr:cupin domain-containing protein [Parashewanella spongiae]MCL1079905.1 cupin domain-containing protein [Parashewanella spongiae]RJY06461.1 cupin domain-containing protein [Parashewanella spongiae]